MKNKVKVSVSQTDDKAKIPLRKKEIAELLSLVSEQENAKVSVLEVVFVGAEFIRELNVRFLGHDYETDVITFPLNSDDDPIEGEIYICVKVAREQAGKYNISYRDELINLVIHGMLHLIGYNDSEIRSREKMIALGNKYKKFYTDEKLDENKTNS